MRPAHSRKLLAIKDPSCPKPVAPAGTLLYQDFRKRPSQKAGARGEPDRVGVAPG
jgi:hypothetical protein